jgi:hypothetical protein
MIFDEQTNNFIGRDYNLGQPYTFLHSCRAINAHPSTTSKDIAALPNSPSTTKKVCFDSHSQPARMDWDSIAQQDEYPFLNDDGIQFHCLTTTTSRSSCAPESLTALGQLVYSARSRMAPIAYFDLREQASLPSFQADYDSSTDEEGGGEQWESDGDDYVSPPPPLISLGSPREKAPLKQRSKPLPSSQVLVVPPTPTIPALACTPVTPSPRPVASTVHQAVGGDLFSPTINFHVRSIQYDFFISYLQKEYHAASSNWNNTTMTAKVSTHPTAISVHSLLIFFKLFFLTITEHPVRLSLIRVDNSKAKFLFQIQAYFLNTSMLVKTVELPTHHGTSFSCSFLFF